MMLLGCGAKNRDSASAREDEAKQMHSSQLDRQIDYDRQQEAGKIKILVLGAAESGKSTIMKQMRLLYGYPLSDDETSMYIAAVRSNIVIAIKKLCILLRKLGLEEALAAESAFSNGTGVMTPKTAYEEVTKGIVNKRGGLVLDNRGSFVVDEVSKGNNQYREVYAGSSRFLEHVEAIRVLWESNTMKDVWLKRATVNVIDSHREFLQDLNRIASEDYIPTPYDVLVTRLRTKHAVMERYCVDGIDYEMTDVGGQRADRGKWIHFFDNQDAVIFVAALSEYDQTLTESRHVNRMVEALQLFRSICKNRAFANTTILLFLNKRDIFAEKVMYSNIRDQPAFRDYRGRPQNFDDGVQYFKTKFLECINPNHRFVHITCAIDSNNMEFVMSSTQKSIMEDNLKRAGVS
mmetsp:Transcript_46776/g.69188  ORF Transcript_46776/g.69188 Transcript_46776/m.69188 type:complete len:405 (+) Transcript_46776:177-1391(+)